MPPLLFADNVLQIENVTHEYDANHKSQNRLCLSDEKEISDTKRINRLKTGTSKNLVYS